MHNVSTEEMMLARDKRAAKQKSLILSYPALICFTMNIAGPIKINKLIEMAFNEGMMMLLDQLKISGIPCLHQEVYFLETGPEGYFCCNEDPLILKQLMIGLEDLNSLTRLFDLDVITAEGFKISRNGLDIHPRKCMLCDNDAAECARSRKHSINELTTYYSKIIKEYFLAKSLCLICNNAIQSLLFEATIAPKPGLVDRFDNGSHNDMNIFTFIKSSCFFIEPFKQYLDIGTKYLPDQPSELIKALRTQGRNCEAAMLRATSNINTHKGANFSYALFLGAIGCLMKNKHHFSWNNVQEMIIKMMLSDTLNIRPDSYGKTIESKYQLGGIIKEACNGYPSIFKVSLPFFKQRLAYGRSFETAAIETLFKLMVIIEDTNLYHHSTHEEIFHLKNDISNFLAKNSDEEKVLSFARELNIILSRKQISPGGSADLLAITLFCYYCETNTKYLFK